MLNKRKKILIICGSVFLGIIVLCTIFALVFRLKTVDVEFRSRAVNTNLSEEAPTRVLETGEFDFGKNILFMNFEENIAKIEKSNPFVKVEQVIRHFPNIVRVYISEREPKYRVKDKATITTSWYILDAEFKILDKVSEAELTEKAVCGNSNYFDQTIEISANTLTFDSLIIGEFATSNINAYLEQITTGFYGKTKDYTAIRQIDYNAETETFNIVMRNEALDNQKGCTVVIKQTDDLYQKSLKAAACFISGQIVDDEEKRFENSQNVLLEIYKNQNGSYVAIASNI